jgi:hypothetical protein
MNISTSIAVNPSTVEQHTGISSFWNPVQILFSNRQKIHDLTHYECGSDYVFEEIEQGARGYMTGQARGIRVNDYILLSPDGKQTIRYRVEVIDYYASPPDMWTAVLYRLPDGMEGA